MTFFISAPLPEKMQKLTKFDFPMLLKCKRVICSIICCIFAVEKYKRGSPFRMIMNGHKIKTIVDENNIDAPKVLFFPKC